MTIETDEPEAQADPAPVLPDEPSVAMALLGILMPPAGVLTYFMLRGVRPMRARSALRGAVAGLFFWVVWTIITPNGSRSRESAKRASCQSNLKQMGMAVKQYSQDNDDKLPDLGSAASIRAALERYAPAPEVFACLEGELPYQGNPALSLKKLDKVAAPATKVMFYCGEPAHLGGRNICYADGHVKWMKEERWQAVKGKSGIR